MSRIIVVTPTYNERDNISVLVKKLFSLNISGLELWVIDDNSPDGTADVVQDLSLKYPINLISRAKKEGLGMAYAAGFKSILNQSNQPDYVIQMDADLSHDPAMIPVMIKKMSEYDLVLGSRYVTGGGVENWDFFRRLISRWSNSYARLVLGLPFKDLTGGFKCWSGAVLEKIGLDSLSSVGYNFQIETTYKAHKLGFRICEVPIVFTERKRGASKFNVGIIGESFIKVLFLRFRS